jgi:RNA-directed DNA polymerase
MSVLVAAWHEIRRNGETSRSLATREEVRKFGYDLPRNLQGIQRRLRTGYVFSGAKGATPSKGAGKSGKRPLVIAPLADRIVQRAILDVLQAAVELPGVQAVLATKTSIGGIKGRGVAHALDMIDQAYEAGARFVAGSDIAGFFTLIPRNAVVDFLRSETEQADFVALFESALTVELANAASMSLDDLRLFPTDAAGVAQGCPLSALAGNIVLRDFDEQMNDPARGVVCVRYIDDFILVGKDERQVRKAMGAAARILGGMGMQIYDPKTSPNKAFRGGISDGHVFLGYEVVPGLFPPSDGARERLISRIAAELSAGRNAMRSALADEPILVRRACYVETLNSVDQIVRGWAGSFQRSRCLPTMKALDRHIDGMLGDFTNFFRRLTTDLDPVSHRRVLGIRLLQDRL